MKKISKVVAIACAAACFGSSNAFAISSTTQGDTRNIDLNWFDSSVPDSNWIADRNTDLNQGMYKFRIMRTADTSVSNPLTVEADGSGLVMPVETGVTYYRMPVDVEDFKLLLKPAGTSPTGSAMFSLKCELWYEPATASTKYNSDSTSSNVPLTINLKGKHRCTTCGAEYWEKGVLMRSTGTSGENDLFNEINDIPVNTAKSRTCDRWIHPDHAVYESFPCESAGCRGTAKLEMAYFNIVLDPKTLEGFNTADSSIFANGTAGEQSRLKDEYIGKLHLEKFSLGRTITPGENGSEGQRVNVLQDTGIIESDAGYRLSTKVFNFTGGTYAPALIIAGYKDGRLKDVKVSKNPVFNAWNGGAYSQYHSGDSMVNFTGDEIKTDLLPKGDYDTVRGYIWKDLTSLTPEISAID